MCQGDTAGERERQDSYWVCLNLRGPCHLCPYQAAASIQSLPHT